jgi:flagellar biosynthesis protein FlhF
MNIKRYRANSLREALEQVKQELGEDALVLETKAVRAGGLLGFGAREQIEVRVAADLAAPKARPSAKPQPAEAKISLTDAAPAGLKTESSRTSTFAALAARAYADEARHRTVSKPSEPAAEPKQIGVEIAETAPRIVHARRPAAAQKNAAASVAVAEPVEAAVLKTGSLTSEFDRLRAELREMKLSLGALAARPAAYEARFQEKLTQLEADSEIYDSPYYEAFLELTATGLEAELARAAVRSMITPGANHARQASIERYSELLAAGLSPTLARQKMRAALLNGLRDLRTSAEIAREGLGRLLPSIIDFADDPLPTRLNQTAASKGLVFVGPTGVGKTTTIAKLAARVALRARRRVELITLDTYRIAAVEQLKTYAEIIGAGCHVARSVVELDALARRFEGEAQVIIDTIGRSPHDLADQMELADYLRANDELVKCLTLQATIHPVDAQVAIRKFALYGANQLVLTKLDETARPGTTITVAAEAGLPLAYLCAGQRVPEDLERATAENFAARVLSRGQAPSVRDE